MFTHFFTILVLLSPSLGVAIRRDDSGWGSPFDSSQTQILFADGGPDWHEVQQGTIGNCWLDATAASLAYAQPDILKAAMVDQNNNAGEVKVTLYDKDVQKIYTEEKPVMSTWISENSIGPSVSGHTPSTWPAVIVMAFFDFAKDVTDMEVAKDLNGGTPYNALEIILGPSWTINYKELSTTSDDEIWSILLNSKNVATMSSIIGVEYADNGLPGGHSYSVLDADKDKATVTLRNPWGKVSDKSVHNVDKQGWGKFTISFDDYKKYYYDLTYGSQ